MEILPQDGAMREGFVNQVPRLPGQEEAVQDENQPAVHLPPISIQIGQHVENKALGSAFILPPMQPISSNVNALSRQNKQEACSFKTHL